MRGWRRPRQWLVAVAPLAACFVLLRIYEAWLASRGALPGAYHLQWMTIAERLDASLLRFLVFTLSNLRGIGIEVGLFAAPLAAIWLSAVALGPRRPAADRDRRGQPGDAADRVARAAGSLLLQPRARRRMFRSTPGGWAADDPRRLPHRRAGTRHSPLRSARRAHLDRSRGAGLRAGRRVRGLALVRERAERRSPAPRRASIVLVLATAATYWVVISSIDVFDRYLLFLVPFALVALAASIRAQPAPPRAAAWLVGGALALGSLLWSVGAVQEYLDWNRARWRAIAYLASDLGAGREQIDGGFEYGGWLNFDARFRHDRRGSSWWWVVEDRYAVAFAPIEGYDVLRRFPYRGWFGLVEDDIVALERSTAVASRPRR